MYDNTFVTDMDLATGRTGSNPSGPFVQAKPYRRCEFDVTNGLFQGDREFPNPVSFQKRETFHEVGFSRSYGYSSGQPYTLFADGCSGSYPTTTLGIPTDDWDYLEDQAMADIYEQLRGSANVAVDIAESPETLKMLKQWKRCVGKVSDIVRVIRKAKKQSVAEIMSGTWMSYRYGLMPLVYSTWDAFETFFKTVEKRELVKGRSSERHSYSVANGNGVTSNRLFESLEVSRRVEIGAWFDPRDTKEIYDWTTLNPLLLAWELTPLSFVVDWLINIGDYLSSLENYFIFRDRFRYGYVTRTSKDHRSNIVTRSYSNSLVFQLDGSTPVDGIYAGAAYWSSSRRDVRKDRRVILTLPFPSLPKPRLVMGANRTLDGLALLRGFLSRK